MADQRPTPHEWELLETHARELGRVVGAYNRALIAEGMPERERAAGVAALTKALVATLLTPR